MACRCKIFCPIFFISLFILGVLSAALYVYLTNAGGQEALQAMDSLILERGISPSWCKAVRITSTTTQTFLFNATVTPGEPRIDPTIRQQNTITLNVLVPKAGTHLFRYYLPATSTIKIMQCASQPLLMSYIFKGHDIIDECVKVTMSQLRVSKGHDSCNDIILGRELVLVCRGSRLQPLKGNVAVGDFYLIYYTNTKSDDANVTMQLTINRPGFDFSNRKAHCTQVSNCTLPLTWGTGDTVTLQTGVDLQTNTPGYEVTYTCVPNVAAFVVIFCALPFCFALLVALTVLCIRRVRKRRQMFGDDPVPERPLLRDEPSEEQRYASKEDDGLQHSIGYGTFSPINASTQPTAPSAPSPPSHQPFISDSDMMPYVAREPPPTYEDTMRGDRHTASRRPMKC